MLIADRYEPCRHRRMLEVVLKACPESLMRSILGRVAVWRPIAVSCVARLCRVIGESGRRAAVTLREDSALESLAILIYAVRLTSTIPSSSFRCTDGADVPKLGRRPPRENVWPSESSNGSVFD